MSNLVLDKKRVSRVAYSWSRLSSIEGCVAYKGIEVGSIVYRITCLYV